MKALHIKSALTLFVIIFCASAFANGGGGGGGTPPVKYTGLEYYCFDNIGKQTSTVKLPGTNDYCAPVQQGACSWEWKLDYSDDTPSKINCNAGFACNPALPGMRISKPVDVYQFCVKSNTWHNVAQCVDKKKGTTADSSKCGTGDTNYYWKPKCDPKKSKNDCMWSLEGQQWYSCFSDTTSQGAIDKDGHKVIKEWLGGGIVVI